MPNGITDFFGRLATSVGEVAIAGVEQVSAEILEGLVDQGKQQLLQLVGLAEPPSEGAQVTPASEISDALRALGIGEVGTTLARALELDVGPPVLNLLTNLLGFGGPAPGVAGNGAATVSRGIRLGPELHHTTAIRTRFDPKTGAARQVGGTRVANSITLMQDPQSGRLDFFVFAGAPTHFSKLGKFPRARKASTTARRRAPKKVKVTRHGIHLTPKQIKAGFGGRQAQIAARSR
ncbi:MAG: hypothetical protein V3V67_18480 [Myxococcota bacterium]